MGILGTIALVALVLADIVFVTYVSLKIERMYSRAIDLALENERLKAQLPPKPEPAKSPLAAVLLKQKNNITKIETK